MKINSLTKEKPLGHTWSDKSFRGTVSLLGGSLEITLTVPIKDIK